MNDRTRIGARELKSCPFCGGEWRFNPRGDIHTHPRTDNRCPLEQTSIMNDPREIDRWNMRHGEALAAQGGGADGD